MPARKYVDLAKWRELGGLQEANRLFFHLYGWALSVRLMKGGWTEECIADSEWMRARLYDITEALRATLPQHLLNDASLSIMARAVATRLWPEGSIHMDGVWDASDDPEGIIFGEDPADKAEKAQAVRAIRRSRWVARAKLWTAGRLNFSAPEPVDVEPVDWVYHRDLGQDG